MKVSAIGEFGAIEEIKGLCARPGREVAAGIGDDAAAFRAAKGALTLVTTDMLVEGVHFDLSYTGFLDLGFKAITVNLSDIAAMGGRPRYYLAAVALRPGFRVEDLKIFYAGMEAVAEAFGVKAIGGDTCSTAGPMVVSLTVIGESVSRKLLTRSGARSGDDIYVTGTLGDSAGGLELLKAGTRVREGTQEALLALRHRLPVPKIAEGIKLAKAGLASAMIDISDGFSSDLAHILDESGVGAEVEQGALPVSPNLRGVFGEKKAAGLALHGGEDYGLLFTARRRARKALEKLGGQSFTRVGSITPGKGAYLITAGGVRRPLVPKGYEHFKKCSPAR